MKVSLYMGHIDLLETTEPNGTNNCTVSRASIIVQTFSFVFQPTPIRLSLSGTLKISF